MTLESAFKLELGSLLRVTKPMMGSRAPRVGSIVSLTRLNKSAHQFGATPFLQIMFKPDPSTIQTGAYALTHDEVEPLGGPNGST